MVETAVYHSGLVVTQPSKQSPASQQPGTMASAPPQYGTKHHPTSPTILGERIVDRKVSLPKKVVRQDVIEKLVVVPETVQHEEIVDEVRTVRERIIEVAKPVVQETIVEVPEYVYVDKIVEVPEIIRTEKIREVIRPEVKERIVEVPQVIVQEKVVEVPEIEYRQHVRERIVEVPQIQEHYAIKHVSVPQIVEKEVHQYVNVADPYEVRRNIPVPVESTSVFEYHLPNLVPRVTKVQFPIYIPRFLEVPIAQELLPEALQQELKQQNAQLAQLSTMTQAVSLCELENMAVEARQTNLDQALSGAKMDEALKQAWLNGKLHVISSVRNIQQCSSPRAIERRYSFQ